MISTRMTQDIRCRKRHSVTTCTSVSLTISQAGGQGKVQVPAVVVVVDVVSAFAVIAAHVRHVRLETPNRYVDARLAQRRRTQGGQAARMGLSAAVMPRLRNG